MARALRVLEQDSHGLAVRMLHVPADLHWVSSAGLLPYYWRNFIRNLLGGYTRTIRPPPTTLFMTDAQSISHVSEADDDDEQSDEDDDAGVFAAQTRQSRDRRPPDGSAGSGAGTSRDRRQDGSASAGAGTGAPRRARIDPHALERWGARADKVTDTMKGELERAEERMAKRTDTLHEQFKEGLAKAQAAMAAQSEQQRENSAHLHRTLEKILQNIAANASPELQKAPAVAAAVDAARAAARVAETHYTAADPRSQLEVYAMTRDRAPMRVDSEGFKLGHVTPNRWGDLCDDMKGVYESRDRVVDEPGYMAIGDRCCTNCPPDAPNMPHRQKSCPFDWRPGKAGEAKLAPAIVSRGRQRVRDNIHRLKAGQPAILVVQAGPSVDSDSE